MSWIQRLLGVDPAEAAASPMSTPDYEEYSALSVLPRQPFATWLSSWSSGPNEDLASLRSQDDRTVYLTPSYEGSWDGEAILELVYSEIFENELTEWCETPDLWPSPRDLKTFKKWFDVAWHSAVVDLR